jgi:hypothetical protein
VVAADESAELQHGGKELPQTVVLAQGLKAKRA